MDEVVFKHPAPVIYEKKATTRNAVVDYAKFLGATAIVWFHFKLPGFQFSYAALPMFLTFHIYYLMMGLGQCSFLNVLRKRSQRLLLPWVAWSLIFAALKIIQALTNSEAISNEFSWWMLGTGPAVHLWFLPFAFLLGLAIQLIFFYINHSVNCFWGTLILYVPCTVFCAYLISEAGLGIPFDQWVFILPAGMVGFLVAMTHMRSGLTFFVVAAILTSFLISHEFGWEKGNLPLVIGTTIGLACLHFQVKSTALSQAVGELALGIYLVHPVFVGLLQQWSAFSRSAMIHFCLTLVLSIITILLFRRSKFLKTIV